MKRWFALGFLVTVPAHGIVNTEPLRYDLEKDHHAGKISGSFGGKDGNTRGLFLDMSVFAGFLSEPHLGFLDASGEYAQFDGEIKDQNSFLHLRYNYRPLSWMHPEVFGQLETDRFRDLKLRALIGTGPRFVLVKEFLFFGSAYMLEHETENDEKILSHRWSNYLSIYWNLDEVTVANTFYYQPRFDKFSDYRLLDSATIETELGKRFSSGVSFVIKSDSQPPSGVLSLDWEVLNTFSLHLF